MENQSCNFTENNRGYHSHFGPSRIVAMVVGAVVVAVIFSFLFGWLVMLLWNWLMPDLFKLATITYWQGFGIVLLARLLFGGLHHDHHRNHRHHPHFLPHHNMSWADRDEWIPAGDHRNWRHYRQYWKERGKKDFEDYLDTIKQNKTE